jgi:hypothetical protein
MFTPQPSNAHNPRDHFNMSTLRETLNTLNQSAEVFARELDAAGYRNYNFSQSNSPYDLSFLSADGLLARGAVIATAERILRLAKGPQACLSTMEETVEHPSHSPYKNVHWSL